jgi:hypothetical protein
VAKFPSLNCVFNNAGLILLMRHPWMTENCRTKF